jgi:hypothetical protein
MARPPSPAAVKEKAARNPGGHVVTNLKAESVNYNRHAHPRVNAALPVRHAQRERRITRDWSRVGLARFHDQVRLRLVGLQTLGSGYGVIGQLVQEGDEPASERSHPGKGVRFSSLVLHHQSASAIDVDGDQLKFSR